MARLVARDVMKVFPPTRAGQDPVVALRNISFEAEGHAFVTLVGPSGCGKSTFLNMVSGIDSPSAGTLEVNGKAAEEARIGYVFQDPRLLPWKTVIQNMEYVLDDGSHDDRSARGRRFLDMVNLGASAQMYPGQLSGGMQQRVGIARALAIEPDLLLMDEPFSHLDAITARDLRVELQRLWLDTDTTILFVTHDVLEAVLLSSRVIMMSSQGLVFRDLTIDLPFPRRQTDREVAIQQTEILELFEEMERPMVDV
ncbi:MAG TPA: ABC transporter ATP-binding protein [Actinomycetota bacterium]|nr:ABC transporter ATP-binding protein [Actinomycetota bacterium]